VTVLDASALLAYLHDEPGAKRVQEALVQAALMSSVNLAEVLAKLADEGQGPEEVMDRIGVLPFDVVAFDEAQALESALLRTSTAVAGLSLGDRSCLALGRRLGRPVLTTDRAWHGLVPGLEVELIR
jgi:PIN domain nuclease of toxin-antitoxin system